MTVVIISFISQSLVCVCVRARARTTFRLRKARVFGAWALH